jgi:poly(3-hydroxybutyrate) depolymerase
MADRWQAKLSRPIVMRDGTKLETLAEAGAFILALPEGYKEHNSWRRATELLMEAALHEGDIKTATEAIERAGFIQFLWMPRTSPRSKS